MLPKTQNALENLRGKIESGEFQTGNRLPPERELCDNLGISRSGLRKILSIMEAENLLWRHIGKGTFVGPRPALSTEAFNIVTRTTNPLEIMEVRLMLEPKIAASAAQRASFLEFEKLEHCAKRCDEAKDFATNEKWDVLLHETIVISTRNSLLISLYTGISQMRQTKEWGLKKEAFITPKNWNTYQKQHSEIIKAIKSRDSSGAENAMRAHLQSVNEHIQATY
jgi:DNA-binding FadR family transcriptional regulator